MDDRQAAQPDSAGYDEDVHSVSSYDFIPSPHNKIASLRGPPAWHEDHPRDEPEDVSAQDYVVTPPQPVAELFNNPTIYVPPGFFETMANSPGLNLSEPPSYPFHGQDFFPTNPPGYDLSEPPSQSHYGHAFFPTNPPGFGLSEPPYHHPYGYAFSSTSPPWPNLNPAASEFTPKLARAVPATTSFLHQEALPSSHEGLATPSPISLPVEDVVAQLLDPPVSWHDPADWATIGLPFVMRVIGSVDMTFSSEYSRAVLKKDSELYRRGPELGMPREYMTWLCGEDTPRMNVLGIPRWKLNRDAKDEKTEGTERPDNTEEAAVETDWTQRSETARKFERNEETRKASGAEKHAKNVRSGKKPRIRGNADVRKARRAEKQARMAQESMAQEE